MKMIDVPVFALLLCAGGAAGDSSTVELLLGLCTPDCR
jgi:hypothetical protein